MNGRSSQGLCEKVGVRVGVGGQKIQIVNHRSGPIGSVFFLYQYDRMVGSEFELEWK